MATPRSPYRHLELCGIALRVGGGAKLRRGENEELDWGRVQNGMEKVPGCAVIP